MSLLENKIALITGASSGLGAETARLFASYGATVFLGGRDSERLTAVVDEIKQAGGNAGSHSFDVADPSACREAVAACIAQYGRIDCLINIAGVHAMRHSVDVTAQQWHSDISTNLSGPFYLSQAALPTLLEHNGNIVNVASIAGLQGQAYSAGYCAAKHGLLGLTKSLALEYINTGLRVNAICPGGMETPQITKLQLPEDIDFDLLMRSAGIRGMSQTRPVAELIAFLASDKASAIHGAVYPVDQGKTVG